MTPLQAEIYNLAHDAGPGGVTSGELQHRAVLPLDRKETVSTVHELVAEGKLIAISVDSQRRYIAATSEHRAALQAQEERNAREKMIAAQAAKAANAAPEPTPIKAADQKASRKRGRDLVQMLEDQADRARVLLEQYLDDIDDPVLQSLINSVNELDMAVEAARERAA